MHIYERNRIEKWAFINSKLAVFMWGVLYFLHPPDRVVDALGYSLIYASATFSIIGSILGVAGLILADTPVFKKKHQGLICEMAGLIVSTCGPLSFLITAVYLAVNQVILQALPVIGFSYALVAFMISRIMVVGRRLYEVE